MATSPVPSPAKIDGELSDAVSQLVSGKRHLLVSDYVSAVSSLQEACRLFSKRYGETANECAEPYFCYGKALLEYSRMESGVLGNALQGVSVEDEEDSDSKGSDDEEEEEQVENPDKITGEEREQIIQQVDAAIDENSRDLEELVEKEKASAAKSQPANEKDGKKAEKEASEAMETSAEADVKTPVVKEPSTEKIDSEVSDKVEESIVKEKVATEAERSKSADEPKATEDKQPAKDAESMDVSEKNIETEDSKDHKEEKKESAAADVKDSKVEKLEKELEGESGGGKTEALEKESQGKSGVKTETLGKELEGKSGVKTEVLQKETEGKSEVKTDALEKESKGKNELKAEEETKSETKELKDDATLKEADNKKSEVEMEEASETKKDEDEKMEESKVEEKACTEDMPEKKECKSAEPEKGDEKTDLVKSAADKEPAATKVVPPVKGDERVPEKEQVGGSNSKKESDKVAAVTEEKNAETESKSNEMETGESGSSEKPREGSTSTASTAEELSKGEAKDAGTKAEAMDVDSEEPKQEKAAEILAPIDEKDEEMDDETVDKNEESVTGGDESESTGEKSQDEGVNQEGDAGPSTSAGPKEASEDDVTNLQLAWEMLELAKVIYKRQSETEKPMELKTAEVLLKLGEVSIESENYSQAIEDLSECLALQKNHLAPHDRAVAETHYQLGLAYSFGNQFELAIENFTSSMKVIEERIAILKQSEQYKLVKKEVSDVKDSEMPATTDNKEKKETASTIDNMEKKETAATTDDMKKKETAATTDDKEKKESIATTDETKDSEKKESVATTTENKDSVEKKESVITDESKDSVEKMDENSASNESASDDPIKKEIEELESLIPDIKTKIEDTEDMMKNTIEAVKEAALQRLAESSAEEVAPPVSEEKAKPVSNISHLVKRKRKPEDEVSSAEADLKKPRSSDEKETHVNGTNGTSTLNGDSKPMDTEECPKVKTAAPVERPPEVESSA